MELSETSLAPQEEETRFDKSFRELKELRSQLHFAADYCETTFLNSEDKKLVMENTKEYICRAVVTLVDHLGNVSANLDDSISNTTDLSEAEMRIDCFKKRILSCEQYIHTVALSQLRWRENLPTHHRRYLSMPNLNYVEKSRQDLRDFNSTKIMEKKEIDTENMPKVMPVHDPVPSKSTNPKFHFQLQLSSPKLHRSRSLNRKPASSLLQSSDILSIIRRPRKSSLQN